MSLFGLDVSEHQTIDFDRLGGASFIIVKASEGWGWADPTYDCNWSEARRVGIIRSAYHFARPDLGNTPREEAEWFLNVVGAFAVGDLAALDYESDPYDQAWWDQCGPARVDWCREWCAAVRQAAGFTPLLYMNMAYKSLADWSPLVADGVGLWIANYDGRAMATEDTAPWPFAIMKQYAVAPSPYPGVSGDIDLDVFFGSRAQLLDHGKRELEADMTDRLNYVTKQEFEDYQAAVRLTLEGTDGGATPESGIKGAVNWLLTRVHAQPNVDAQLAADIVAVQQRIDKLHTI